ncbi:hypothetical protein K469DRAFT_696808 [Zopfia rhizophila CBS 207.26]|uniref:RNA polymerase II degradation factor 1 n=1 Tax=Zopfia rhizophila CBS 207.26 TaxID=1314779 RepID=A0A6A6EJ78_9PEZI|nr:hypothetical protein K469DRAFT_696808 [Zopfia rhizophila CBS 207.26]
MSDVQTRTAPRGRSSARGGRGGHGSRGPRSNKQTNGDHLTSTSIDTSADQGELGELKRRYISQLTTLKELFPDWTDVDLVLAIEESDGDLQATIERISEGNVSQFSEVKKTKDRSRSKVKETSTVPADSGSGSRGPRIRGGEGVRGGRGRGTERGRGGFRGARGGATNGTRSAGATSIPTLESPAWDTAPVPTEVKENGQATTGEQPAATQTPEPEAPKPAAVPQPKKTWASMFAKPKPAPASPKPVVQPPVPQDQEEPSPAPAETPAHEVAQEAVVEAEELPIPPVADEVAEEPPVAAEDLSNLTPEKPQEGSGQELTLTPSKDELTQDNVEHLPDATQHPPLTETAASTVASSRDISGTAGVATPLSSSGAAAQAPIGRPAMGGYATTAFKAAGVGHRSASFQRRLMEQQEAVVMPGNHAVDRAAVQFGSLGLNGDLDADTLDVDENREEAETRTQPPQHSPVAQPRASLPPAPRQAPPPADTQPQESLPTPKQAPGLPPVPQQQQPLSQQSPPNPLGPQAMQNQESQGNQQYNQFGRYGQGGIQPEQSAPPQKPYDPFGQQAPQSNQYDYPNQQQSQSQAQQQPQSQAGGFSSAPDNFASQYFTSDQQRTAYQNYYQNYNQQNAPGQQEAGSAQQRSGSAFGAGGPNDSNFPPSQQQQTQSRYNEAQNSGHTTPNPALGGQHPTGPASQAQHMHQPHAQPGHTGGYPYNHPYYSSPYYAGYMNQFGNYGQGGYGGFGGKGMYGQPHHYGMSPQTSFDQHSSSPANVGGFSQSSMHGRDSGLGGGLGDYGRSVSQASHNQHSATAGAGFGGLPDMFGRSQASYPNQNSSYGQQQTGQQGGNEDSLKPFGESKTTGGPSPSALGAQPGRPGSATNNTPGQSGQGGLPPPQSHQQGFGGYPSHLNQLQGGQGNQYGGLGGLGHQGAGSHQTGGYGGYSGFGGGYGSYNRGGWGTNYGQH